MSSKQDSVDAASSSVVVEPPPAEERIEETDKSEDFTSEEAQINCCLFCTKCSDNLEANLEHMSSQHGLYIPEIEYLASLEAIVRYLHTVVFEYNECLYCGMTKQSAEGIRQHMLDKGHCMINLEHEPELLEFWEFSDSEGDDTDDEEPSKPPSQRTDALASRDFSEGEYTLPSGKIIGSKSKSREARFFARRTAFAAKDSPSRITTEGSVNKTDTTSPADPAESLIRTRGGPQDRAVTTRDAAGLVGVSGQQVRSLVTVQRKMQRQQALVRASTAWADDKGGSHQKHYKVKMNLRAG
jgi:pre-60S factor REI1